MAPIGSAYFHNLYAANKSHSRHSKNFIRRLSSIQGDHSPDNVKSFEISLTVRGTPPQRLAC